MWHKRWSKLQKRTMNKMLDMDPSDAEATAESASQYETENEPSLAAGAYFINHICTAGIKIKL